VPMFYYHITKDSVSYYAIIDGFSPSVISTLKLFGQDGTEIGKEHGNYETFKNLFAEGKFFYSSSCTSINLNIPGEKTPECDDCPCPEWLEKEFKYYLVQTPVTFFPMLYFMEKDGATYYALQDAASSCITCKVRFFEADGTEIEKDSEYHAAMALLLSEGKFRYNHSCTKKYLEKY
jgi:hypothetical protein